MKPRPILLVSAVLLLGCGVAALFAPEEIAGVLGAQGQATSKVVVQLLGAGLFALGFLDWFVRFATIGGLYGRPVIVANLAFFFIATTTLGRHAIDSGSGLAWGLTGIVAVLAAWFGRFLLYPPAEQVR